MLTLQTPIIAAGSTIVFNGDVLTDTALLDVIRYHKEKRAEATIVMARVMNPTGYGLVEADSDGRVTGFTEKPPEDSGGFSLSRF